MHRAQAQSPERGTVTAWRQEPQPLPCGAQASLPTPARNGDLPQPYPNRPKAHDLTLPVIHGYNPLRAQNPSAQGKIRAPIPTEERNHRTPTLKNTPNYFDHLDRSDCGSCRYVARHVGRLLAHPPAQPPAPRLLTPCPRLKNHSDRFDSPD
jgi:hypothetical protein